jgi:hypothetical protein
MCMHCFFLSVRHCLSVQTSKGRCLTYVQILRIRNLYCSTASRGALAGARVLNQARRVEG